MPKRFRCKSRRIAKLQLQVHAKLGVTIAKCSQFASGSMCEKIIQLAENHGFQTGEGSNADTAYPQATVDIEIDKAPALRRSLLKHRLVEELSKVMMITHSQYPIGFDDVFIVRYLAEEQRQLMRHYDGGDISFMLALSSRDDYDGGGTRFDALGGASNILHLDRGDLVVFDAKLFHSGVEITRGSRYLLVGFTYTHQSSIRPGHLNLDLAIDSGSHKYETKGMRMNLKRKSPLESEHESSKSAGKPVKKFKNLEN